MRLTGWGAGRVKEMTFFDGQKLSENRDGSVSIQFETEDLFTAADFVTSMAGEAKATKPRELAEKVRETVCALAKAHPKK